MGDTSARGAYVARIERYLNSPLGADTSKAARDALLKLHPEALALGYTPKTERIHATRQLIESLAMERVSPRCAQASG